MNILVTGGAGYVGSTLVNSLLAEGHRVRVVDSLMHGGEGLLAFWSHPEFEFVRGDLREPDVVKKAVDGVEAVVHLAAIVGDPACARQPEIARAVNVNASKALLRESKRKGVRRFVFASTCSNYGKMKDSSSYVNESSELSPVSLYAETKVAVENEVLAYSNISSDQVGTPLRFATVFGVSPRMRFDLTVNEFTKELMMKKRLVVFGEQFWRPYIHVRDVASAVALILKTPVGTLAGQAFNVGSTQQNYQKQQLVEMIRPLAPDCVIEYVKKEEDPRDYRVSFEKIKTQLGFEATRSVGQGINEVAQLVADHVINNMESSTLSN